MYVVVIAWLYVVLMASVAEAVNSTGTVLGAIITFLLYGILPLGIVVYIFGTPGRKRLLHARAIAERAEADKERDAASLVIAADTPAAAATTTETAPAITSVAPDADGKTPA